MSLLAAKSPREFVRSGGKHAGMMFVISETAGI